MLDFLHFQRLFYLPTNRTKCYAQNVLFNRKAISGHPANNTRHRCHCRCRSTQSCECVRDVSRLSGPFDRVRVEPVLRSMALHEQRPQLLQWWPQDAVDKIAAVATSGALAGYAAPFVAKPMLDLQGSEIAQFLVGV